MFRFQGLTRKVNLFFSFPTFWAVWYLSSGGFCLTSSVLGICAFHWGNIPVQRNPAKKSLLYLAYHMFSETSCPGMNILKIKLTSRLACLVVKSVLRQEPLNGGDEGKRNYN